MTDDVAGYSPGLKGVVAGETALARVDGANGRLVYRGYPIGVVRITHPHFTRVGQVYGDGNPARGTIRASHEHERLGTSGGGGGAASGAQWAVGVADKASPPIRRKRRRRVD